MIKQRTYFIGKEFNDNGNDNGNDNDNDNGNDNDNDKELSLKAHNLSLGHNSTSIRSLHREIDKAIDEYGWSAIHNGIGKRATDVLSSSGPLWSSSITDLADPYY